jgi:two-component system response regulator NreC
MSVEYLTVREVQTLQLLADGKKWDTIAASLHISKNTLNNHRARIMDKLGAVDTCNAIYIATKSNII